MANFCPNCGMRVSETDSFCQGCGTPLASATYPNQFSQQTESQQSVNQPMNEATVKKYEKIQASWPYLGFLCAFLSVFLFAVPSLSIIAGLLGIIFSSVGCKHRYKHNVLGIIGLAASIIFLILQIFSWFNKATAKPSGNAQIQVVVQTVTSSNSSETNEIIEPISENAYSFSVSDRTSFLNIGEIAEISDNCYAGITCVRTSDELSTGVFNLPDNLTETQEVIYVFAELYNPTSNYQVFYSNVITCYEDSVLAVEPEYSSAVTLDGYEASEISSLEPGTTDLLLKTFIVEESWQELNLFIDGISWKITHDDISEDPFVYQGIFNLDTSVVPTEVGSVVYSGDFQVTYDGFELHDFGAFGKSATFLFTVENTSDEVLTYENFGTSSLVYQNYCLLDRCILSGENVNDHTCAFSLSELQPGMSAQIYLAYPVTEDEGSFQCFYNNGVLIHNNLGVVYAVSE